MNLTPAPLNMIREGRKTIELRLYDEKRKQISIGDIITFVNTEDKDDELTARVTDLYVFNTFDELYKKLPLLECGYTEDDIASASPSDMELYYPKDKQKLYGVVGIKLSLDVQEIEKIWGLFFDVSPDNILILESRDDEDDFREAIRIDLTDEERYVLKFAANDFSSPGKVEMWGRTAAEYRNLGYYAPKIIADKSGHFPMVEYKGRKCVAYVEEFAPYKYAGEHRDGDNVDLVPKELYLHDVWRMTAKIAQKHFDFTEYPSEWCIFELFDSTCEVDEIMENALAWKEYADGLPEEFRDQVDRIWRLWEENKNALEPVYRKLPKSVFQADMCSSNLLLDEENKLVGVFDFNLAGKEVVLNYLFRETYGNDFEDEIELLREMLKVVGEYYDYSDIEKQLVLMIYRYLKPLWYIKAENLRKLKDDWTAVRAYLNKTEEYLTKDIDFVSYMVKQ